MAPATAALGTGGAGGQLLERPNTPVSRARVDGRLSPAAAEFSPVTVAHVGGSTTPLPSHVA